MVSDEHLLAVKLTQQDTENDDDGSDLGESIPRPLLEPARGTTGLGIVQIPNTPLPQETQQKMQQQTERVTQQQIRQEARQSLAATPEAASYPTTTAVEDSSSKLLPNLQAEGEKAVPSQTSPSMRDSHAFTDLMEDILAVATSVESTEYSLNSLPQPFASVISPLPTPHDGSTITGVLPDARSISSRPTPPAAVVSAPSIAETTATAPSNPISRTSSSTPLVVPYPTRASTDIEAPLPNEAARTAMEPLTMEELLRPTGIKRASTDDARFTRKNKRHSRASHNWNDDDKPAEAPSVLQARLRREHFRRLKAQASTSPRVAGRSSVSSSSATSSTARNTSFTTLDPNGTMGDKLLAIDGATNSHALKEDTAVRAPLAPQTTATIAAAVPSAVAAIKLASNKPHEAVRTPEHSHKFNAFVPRSSGRAASPISIGSESPPPRPDSIKEKATTPLARSTSTAATPGSNPLSPMVVDDEPLLKTTASHPHPQSTSTAPLDPQQPFATTTAPDSPPRRAPKSPASIVVSSSSHPTFVPQPLARSN